VNLKSIKFLGVPLAFLCSWGITKDVRIDKMGTVFFYFWKRARSNGINRRASGERNRVSFGSRT
jgi:hypothetical protein